MTSGAADSLESRTRRVLETLGWQTVSVGAGARTREVSLLHDVLKDRLNALNFFEHNGQQHLFDEAAMDTAARALAVPRDRATGYDNERIWRLLRFGVPVQQTVDGHPRSFTARYIDWAAPDNNVYHLVTDLKVAGVGATSSYQPDITLFVNGIPFVVIECKEHGSAVDHLLQVQAQERAYELFRYAQLLIGLQGEEEAYGAVGSTRENWQIWTRVEDTTSAPSPVRAEAERILDALCRPDRLLEWASTFTFFEAGVRRVARPHQFFAVRDVLQRVLPLSPQEVRFGGVVWQAPGTGRSATMAMTAVALLEKVKESNTRVLLLSDRLTVEEKLLRAFSGSGIECRRASTGRELLDLLENSQIRVITSVIEKFDAATRSQTSRIDNPNIFVLFACFVGFTSSPTLDSLDHFGPLITCPYSMEHAMRDGVLLPLYYEERNVAGKLPPNNEDLEDDASAETMESEELIRARAADVGQHFVQHFGDTPLKGILIAGSPAEALAYKQELDDLGAVTSGLLLTAPRPSRRRFSRALQDFHAANARKFGSAQRYEEDLLDRFNHSSHPQILICVDRFVGLDVPRCGVIYLMRRLKESGLMQAVSRGTRSWGEKAHGLAVDYSNQHRVLADALEMKPAQSGPSLWIPDSREAGSRPRLLRRFAVVLEASQLESMLPPNPASQESMARDGFTEAIEEGLQQSGQRLAAGQIEALSQRIHDAVLRNRKIDWTLSAQARNRMMAVIEDELFLVRDEEGRALGVGVIDRILSGCLAVAVGHLA
jgi:type I restriction enzyme, R subunit